MLYHLFKLVKIVLPISYIIKICLARTMELLRETFFNQLECSSTLYILYYICIHIYCISFTMQKIKIVCKDWKQIKIHMFNYRIQSI